MTDQFYVRDCGPADQPYWDSPTVQSRYCKNQHLWVLRSPDPLPGLVRVEPFVIRNYFKVGW